MADGDRQVSNKRTTVGRFVHNSWTNMNIRAGKYKHLQTKHKCKAYEHIEVLIDRPTYKEWCLSQKDLIESLDRPSLDRIDSKGHYELGNLRIIELSDNIRQKRYGNAYMQGPKANKKRGVRKSGNKYIARICIKYKEIHLGTFNTKEEAYDAFSLAYYNHYKTTPWKQVKSEEVGIEQS